MKPTGACAEEACSGTADAGCACLMRTVRALTAGERVLGWCRNECRNAPVVYVFGGKTQTAQHVHHECWNCGREVLSTYLQTYKCLDCGVEQCSAETIRTADFYDPDFAAEHSSPA